MAQIFLVDLEPSSTFLILLPLQRKRFSMP